MKLTTLKIKDQEVEVTVTERGWFEATVGEGNDALRATSKTLDEVVKQITVKLRGAALRVAIPVTVVEVDTLVHGFLVGIHAGNGNLLLRVDGKARTMSGYSGGLYRRLTAEQGAELIAARDAFNAASATYNKLNRELGINNHTARELMRKAAAGEEAEEAQEGQASPSPQDA